MATYTELRELVDGGVLLKRLVAAVVISAEAELSATPGTASGRAWALKVLQAPQSWANVAYNAVLAANKDSSVAQIEGASDATIQTNVDSIRQALINADAGV